MAKPIWKGEGELSTRVSGLDPTAIVLWLGEEATADPTWDASGKLSTRVSGLDVTGRATRVLSPDDSTSLV